MQGAVHRARTIPSLYEGRRGLDPLAVLLVAAITVALLVPLLLYRALPDTDRTQRPIAVVNLDIPPPPPASPPPKPVPPKPVVAVFAPPPLIATPALKPAPITTQPEPVQATPSLSNERDTAEPVQPAPSRTVSAGDLSTSMVHAPPPRYPRESRRQREQGTVILRILLDTDGGVAEIGIARSSGHRRLDQAALDAVKKWRWQPAIRQGVPVQVRGSVEIPFVISGISSD